MILIAQIIFTVLAWRVGWGAKALIPLGVAFGVGLISGAAGGAGVAENPVVIVLDVIAMLVSLSMWLWWKPAPKDATPGAPQV